MVISRKLRDDELIKRYLEPDPHATSPAKWRVKEYGVPVWVLVANVLPDWSNAAQVASDYQIPVESLNAVRVYYRRNKEIIDAWNLTNWA